MTHPELRTMVGPLLFSALPDPVFIVSPEGVFLDANPAAVRYFRRPAEEVIGRSVTELFPADQAERQLAVVREVLETGKPFVEERPTVLGEDRYVFRYTVEAFGPAGAEPIGVLGILQDVTTFVELERKYAALYEGATDALFAIDMQGTLRALNREAEVMSGYSRDEFQRLKIWDVIDPGEVERLQGYLKARVAGEEAPTRYENRWIHGSGESRWAEVRISRKPVDDGVFQASVRDITERRRLEELRRDFIQLVSHDVKTPLTVVQGFAKLLLEGRCGEPSPQQAKCLAQIQEASQRIGRMMEQFLTAEQLDSGEPWEPNPGPAAALADGVVRSFLADAEARGVELTQRLEVPQELLVTDWEAAQRILDNLVSNALKYTPAGGRVAVRLSPKEGGLAMVVEDTGAGIPPQELCRVFQRFFRASTALGQRGSGLGLYITRRLAERCGGRVCATSEPGSGSSFEAWLPVAEGPQETLG